MTRNALIIDSRFSSEGIPLVHAPVGGYFDFESVKVLAKRMKTLPDVPTIVHVHRYRDAMTAIFARKIAKRPDVKIVATRHAVKKGRNSLLFRLIYENIDTHVFISNIAYESFKRSLTYRLSKHNKNIYILRYSLDLNSEMESPQPAGGPFTFLYLGEISKGKGIENIFEAMGKIPKRKFRLRICGQGDPDYLDHLRGLAMRHNVMESIDWKITSDTDIDKAVQACAGIIPSLDREASVMSSLMFMAAGKPQIATSNGVQSEFLENRNTALIIPPGNADELAMAMTELVSNPDCCSQLGDNARNLYNRMFSWPHFIKIIGDIYLNNN